MVVRPGGAWADKPEPRMLTSPGGDQRVFLMAEASGFNEDTIDDGG